MTDYPDYQTPQANATAIAGTGVPLLTLANALIDETAVSVSSGSPVSYPASGEQSVTQIGYEGQLILDGGGSSLTVLEVELAWFNNGIQVCVETFYLMPPTTAYVHEVQFSGPTKGNGLIATLSCVEGTLVSVGTFIMLQNSRVYTKSIWQTTYFEGTFPNGDSAIAADPANGIIAAASVSVPAGTTNTYVLPFYNGRYQIEANSGSDTDNGQIIITNASDPNVVGTLMLNRGLSSTGNIDDHDLTLPNSQCTIGIRNEATNAQTFNVTILATDY